MTYYSWKYCHTVSGVWLFFLICFTNPSRVIWYGLDKYYNETNTFYPSSGKSLFLLTWFQHYLCALLFTLGLSVTSRSALGLCPSVYYLIQPSFFVCVYRSIWTCAPQQSSIPPASPTLAAPAPLVTTLCFPTTHYRMSPASPSTSTSMETSKHEPRPPQLDLP